MPGTQCAWVSRKCRSIHWSGNVHAQASGGGSLPQLSAADKKKLQRRILLSLLTTSGTMRYVLSQAGTLSLCRGDLPRTGMGAGSLYAGSYCLPGQQFWTQGRDYADESSANPLD